jgi:hypothetical protein
VSTLARILAVAASETSLILLLAMPATRLMRSRSAALRNFGFVE